MNHNGSKEKFSSTLAVFFATLGSALGLGNIWKFPYVTGENGGAAFIIVYLLFILLMGIPVMLGEFFIGRHTNCNAIGAFNKLKNGRHFKFIGWLGFITAFFILFFYSAVGGWVLSYFFKALKGDFASLGSLPVEEATTLASSIFNETMGHSFYPMMWQFIMIAIVAIILMAGIKKGIEKVTKTLMPVLLVLILICVIRALSLPKAMEGINFLLYPDFSKLTTDSIVNAMGLAFFKLSLALGVMITYSSYFSKDTNLVGTSFKVAFSDVLISMLAGLAIFPVVFQFGLAPSEGPGLLFQSIPLAFASLPFGNVLLSVFFLLTGIAATTAMISLLEVPVSILSQEFHLNRKSSVIICSAIVITVGVITVHPESIFGGTTIFGLSFFDFFDYVTAKLIMPFCGILISIFIGYFVPRKDFINEITNEGTLLKNNTLSPIICFSLKFIAPILISLILITSLGLI